MTGKRGGFKAPSLKNRSSALKRVLDYTFYVAVIAAIIYHMVSVVYPLQSNIEHLNSHLAFSLLLVFLAALRKAPKRWFVLVPLILLTVAITGYVKVFYWDIEAHFGIRTTVELVTAILLIVLVIEGCRQAMGNVVPIVALIFIVYIFFGSYLPRGPFHIAKIDPVEIINMLTYQFSGGAIYGQLLEVSAYFVIIFTIMGGVMQITAAPILIRNLGLIVGRRLRGGPALMCIVGSSLVGMVTGAATPNIIVVGSFTIPLMKKVGYAPKEAAAIEAAASNGGQIMPPVMGAAAFVMAMVTGISYVTIMAAALIPALLYFLSLGMYCQLL
ncbi:MAG: TRAP transporter large permease subunit, partial [Chloroflexota bacterium]